MRIKDKKLRERLQFNLFIKHYDINGNIEQSESPDFLIKMHDYIIGVELTGYLQNNSNIGSFLRELEYNQDKIKEIIEAELSEYRLLILLSWKDKITIKKAEVRSIANSLIELIKKNIPDIDSERRLSGKDGLPSYLINLFIWSNNVKKTQIATTRAVWVREINRVEIENIIKKKEKKINDYREKCNEIWLLIVIEGISPSSIIDISSEAINRKYVFKFDKVLLFDVIEDRIFELKKELQDA